MVRLSLIVAFVFGLASATCAQAETPEEWVTLGARVHGAFGAFIPLGVRIGEEALAELGEKPRNVTVLYYDSDKAPCACIADGVALATIASVGQRTLKIAPEKAPAGDLAVIELRSKATGKSVRYEVPDSTLPRLGEINAKYDPRGRYDAVMSAKGMYKQLSD
jgi:formylmethanofuran dehydrogenase subunit E